MSIKGRKIGEYLVGHRLGVGGMAEVYAAERRGSGGFRRAVALKVLRAHLRPLPAVVERFTREARLAATLRHPNLVPVTDFGVHDEIAYLAMDLVDGPDLRRASLAGMRAGRPLPPWLAVHVAIQVCRGLAHAHRQIALDGRPLGLVHRDVSPQNILLSRNGEVRLTDFGIATAAWAAEESVSGTLQGKFAYLAPEQVEGQPADRRADIFALGVVLWELLAGRRLFLAPTDAETLARVRRCEAPLPPDPRPPSVPEALWAPLAGALARSPEARYDDADAMAAALAAACPEADRGEASRQLTEWLAIVEASSAADEGRAAAAPLPVPPLDVRPATELTPTLVTPLADPPPPRAESPWRRVRGGVGRQPGSGWRRLAVAAGLAGAAALATAAAIESLNLYRSHRAAGMSDVGVAPATRHPTAAAPVQAVAGPLAASAAARQPGAALIVASQPAGAAIEVGGREVGRTPRRVEGLRPGEPILLRLRLDGYRAAERTVTPDTAEVTVIDIVLERAFAMLSLDAAPWAEVWLDGRPLGSTPIFARQVPAGRHAVRLVHPPSGRAKQFVVDLEPDGDVRRRVDLTVPENVRGKARPAWASPSPPSR